MSVTTTAVIEARDVHKSYRRGPEEVHALRGVSLGVGEGEVVVLVGPSGSGKSTLLNVLCGWETADLGNVLWSGSTAARRRGLADLPWDDLALVPQSLGLIEELSVRENVQLPLRLRAGQTHAEDRQDRVDGLLSMFGLRELGSRQPWEISIGEQQRTALARALVLVPRLLLADEPTGHQDEEWGGRVLRALRLVADRGVSCLIASHNPEAARIADRVVRIRDGTIIEDGMGSVPGSIGMTLGGPLESS
jgi:putative ABC transport system ATP-binding protein